MNEIDPRISEDFISRMEKIQGDFELWFFYDKGNKGSDTHEDDGNLHYSEDEFRACFDIGQELSKKDFNQISRSIMNQLGIPKGKQKDGLI